MRRYDMLALSDPETYAQDTELATLARHIADARFTDLAAGTMSRGDFKRHVLAGAYPELVMEGVRALAAEADAHDAAVAAATTIIQGLVMPTGWSATMSDGRVALTGPYDDDLRGRLARVGTWDRDRRQWLVPAEKAKGLARIFANAANAGAAAAASAAATTAHRALERWLSYVEDHAARGLLYKKGIATCRELGIDKAPDLQQRMDAAMTTAAARAAALTQERQASRLRTYIGYVEDAAEQGRIYDKGISECHALGVDHDPSLKARLDAAITRAAERRAARDADRPLSVLVPLNDAPPLHAPVPLFGRLVVFTGLGSKRRIDEDDPSQWGSHLLGHEGEWGAHATYRMATSEETAQHDQQVHDRRTQATVQAERRATLRRWRDHIQRHGERPPDADVPREKRLVLAHLGWDRDSIVITAAAIWYVQYNGADGDDWSQNNCAGAIATCIPYDAAIAHDITAAADAG